MCNMTLNCLFDKNLRKEAIYHVLMWPRSSISLDWVKNNFESSVQKISLLLNRLIGLFEGVTRLVLGESRGYLSNPRIDDVHTTKYLFRDLIIQCPILTIHVEDYCPNMLAA